jgi:hypothetical protein
LRVHHTLAKKTKNSFLQKKNYLSKLWNSTEGFAIKIYGPCRNRGRTIKLNIPPYWTDKNFHCHYYSIWVDNESPPIIQPRTFLKNIISS